MAATAGAGDGRAEGWLGLFSEGRGVFTALLNLGVILHGVNSFVLATVMPTVVVDLGGAAYYAWPAMVYMIGTIIGASSGAPIRNALGRRRGYVLAGLIFLCSTTTASLAPTMAFLLAAQLVQGFGGGLILSQSMALVRELYDGALRARILAVINTTWIAAALIGPAEAGLFAELGWWRGAFVAPIPFGLLLCWLALRHLPSGETSAVSGGIPGLRLALLAAGVLSVAAAGRIAIPAIAVGLIVVAAALVWTTLRLDAKADHALFAKRTLSVFSDVGSAYWVFFLLAIVQAGPTVFLPLLLHVLHGISPLWVGYFNMLMSVTWSTGSFVVAGITARSSTRLAMTIGMACAAVGLAGIGLGVDGASLALLAAWTGLIGLGIGMTNVLAITWTMSIAHHGEETLTASSIPAIKTLGLAFGAAGVGLIANVGGLGDATDPGNVAHALTWVFGLATLAPIAGGLLVLRAFGLNARRGSA